MFSDIIVERGRAYYEKAFDGRLYIAVHKEDLDDVLTAGICRGTTSTRSGDLILHFFPGEAEQSYVDATGTEYDDIAVVAIDASDLTRLALRETQHHDGVMGLHIYTTIDIPPELITTEFSRRETPLRQQP